MLLLLDEGRGAQRRQLGNNARPMVIGVRSTISPAGGLAPGLGQRSRIAHIPTAATAAKGFINSVILRWPAFNYQTGPNGPTDWVQFSIADLPSAVSWIVGLVGKDQPSFRVSSS
jgi:hypothetical protein